MLCLIPPPGLELYEEDGNWVIKDNYWTYPVIKLSQFLNTQHASGAVYKVGDQFTKTRYELPPEENDPSTAQLKSTNCQEMKGKAQPPTDREPIPAFSN